MKWIAIQVLRMIGAACWKCAWPSDVTMSVNLLFGTEPMCRCPGCDCENAADELENDR